MLLATVGESFDEILRSFVSLDAFAFRFADLGPILAASSPKPLLHLAYSCLYARVTYPVLAIDHRESARAYPAQQVSSFDSLFPRVSCDSP